MPTYRRSRSSKKARPSKAPNFKGLNRWLDEVLFELYHKGSKRTYRRSDFAKKEIMNTGAIMKVRKYIKRHRINSFSKLWNTDPFSMGGERTMWVVMHILEDVYDHPEMWFNNFLRKKDGK